MGKVRGVYVGTSGWMYKDWAGSFYPPGLKVSERLPFYMRHFNALEINATFYRMPNPATVAAWTRRFPARYHLVLKGPRRITHFRRLAGCGDLLDYFFGQVLRIPALKVVLWQLPPFLKKDLPLLEGFLRLLPRQVGHAIEFRHPSWWDPEAARLLKRYRCAFTAVSLAGFSDEIFDTTDFFYIRFHGLGPQKYLYNYSARELENWTSRLKPLLGRRKVYAFFNNDIGSFAPPNADLFRGLLLDQ